MGGKRDATALPVVLVHGLRTSRTMWRAQVEALGRAGHPALAIDLPGHGSRCDDVFTFDGAVDAVRAGVDEVGGRALVVGLSLGGYVAITHAARHPEQVAGLVAAACCTRPWWPVVGAWRVASAAIVRLPDRGAGLNHHLVDRMLPPAGATDAGAGGFALTVMTDALREMAAARPLDDLARVEVPVWLVNGRLDHFRGEERRYLRVCRDGRLVVLRGATHLVSLVRPTSFNRVLLEALAELDWHGRDRSAHSGRAPH